LQFSGLSGLQHLTSLRVSPSQFYGAGIKQLAKLSRLHHLDLKPADGSYCEEGVSAALIVGQQAMQAMQLSYLCITCCNSSHVTLNVLWQHNQAVPFQLKLLKPSSSPHNLQSSAPPLVGSLLGPVSAAQPALIDCKHRHLKQGKLQVAILYWLQQQGMP
jgi:hypothetical protein